jgi:MYXO-CTERM domain-containing protein
MMKKAIVLGLAAGLGLGASALASDQPGAAANEWFEEATNGLDFPGLPDSGNLFDAASNVTRGAGSLDFIRASQYTSNEYDVFQISITDAANFSAHLGGFTQGNPESWLALFASDGTALAMSNDISGTIGLSGAHVPGNGIYWLAAGGNGRVHANQFGEALFPWSNAAGEYAATVTGSGDQVATQIVGAVGFSRFSGRKDYTISLTGAGFATVPTPGALALLGLGGVAAVSRRRR